MMKSRAQQQILSALYNLTARCNEWRRQSERKRTLSALLSGAVFSSFTGINFEQDDSLAKADKNNNLKGISE